MSSEIISTKLIEGINPNVLNRLSNNGSTKQSSKLESNRPKGLNISSTNEQLQDFGDDFVDPT